MKIYTDMGLNHNIFYIIYNIYILLEHTSPPDLYGNNNGISFSFNIVSKYLAHSSFSHPTIELIPYSSMKS